MAGFFLLNSSVQATNRGPARLEPDPARLIRFWADTAATNANRKPAIVGTVRHKANALFWNSIEPPLPIDISSQTPIAVHTMNRLVGPTSAGCSEGGVTVSSRNGREKVPSQNGIITSGRSLGDRKSASVDTWAWLAVRLLLQPLDLLQVIRPVRAYSVDVFRYGHIHLKFRMQRRLVQLRQLDPPQQLNSVAACRRGARHQP